MNHTPAQHVSISARLVGLFAGGLLGIAVGALGTAVHRQWQPWMLIAALVATFFAGVWMRGWRGLAAAIAYLVAWGVTVQVLAGVGPGGDVLIAAQPVGYVWIYGGIVAALVAVALPGRWFTPAPDDDSETLEHPSAEQLYGDGDGGLR